MNPAAVVLLAVAFGVAVGFGVLFVQIEREWRQGDWEVSW